MVHPNIRSANRPLADTLTPVYPTTSGLSQAQLNTIILDALKRVDLCDTLLETIQKKYSLCTFERSIRFLHHPDKDVSIEALLDKTHPAWRRVQFDELLAQQLALAQARARRLALGAIAMPLTVGALQTQLVAQLPFELTAAQQRVVEEIIADLNQTQDRKSTRLNSSHVAISYAVFCLKKKKKQNSHCRFTE